MGCWCQWQNNCWSSTCSTAMPRVLLVWHILWEAIAETSANQPHHKECMFAFSQIKANSLVVVHHIPVHILNTQKCTKGTNLHVHLHIHIHIKSHTVNVGAMPCHALHTVYTIHACKLTRGKKTCLHRFGTLLPGAVQCLISCLITLFTLLTLNMP